MIMFVMFMIMAKVFYDNGGWDIDKSGKSLSRGWGIMKAGANLRRLRIRDDISPIGEWSAKARAKTANAKRQ